jgi:hypothetical protein
MKATTATCRIRRILASAGVLTIATTVAALGRGSQAPSGGFDVASAPKIERYIYGAKSCAACHDQDNHPTYEKEDRAGMICRMNEFTRFDTEDKHELAFAALTGPRGQEMSRLLGKDVREIEACVNCHSVPERGVRKQQYKRESDGVTCVGCHGPYAEWVEKHQRINNDEWRDLGRMAKEQLYGMIDLGNPVRRAEICVSCHIGNHAEGKVVTHDMCAAGHPPFPSFELATFSAAQPRHWEYLSEKSLERRNRIKPAPDRRNLPQTQLIVIGGLVALRESMKLLADEAMANKPDPVGAQWPDFARFECYACHHDLQAKNGSSWRQVRRRDGQPGRPTPPDWPLILVRLGVAAMGSQESAIVERQLREKLAGFQESMKGRVFGDPNRVVPAAQKLAAWADSTIRGLSGRVIDAAIARRLLDQLCHMARETIPDYESARQIAWAFRIIYHESVPEQERDSTIEHALVDLGTNLALNLPPEHKQVPIETALQARLRSVADFEPESFKALFATIAGRLARQEPIQAGVQ